jgi:6-phospho-beta-glucosidase
MSNEKKGKGLKVCVIGAGSTYTPELFDGFIKRKDELPVSSFYLMDIDEHKMGIVSSLVKRMMDANDYKCEIVLTTDLQEAIKDADFVLGQIRVGILDARINDEKIPLKYDLIGQETTGVGGFFKALRTIPVMMEICSLMKKYCPDAWLINFSNPSGLIAETLLNNTDIKMMGLCNAPIYMKKNTMDKLPKGSKNVNIEYIGLNHLSWITKIECDGKDVLQDGLGEKVDAFGMKNITKFELDPDLVKSIKGIPSGYLTYFYYRDKQLKHLKEEKQSRGEVCKDIEKELLELYQNPEIVSKPEVLDKRGGAMYSEAAVSLVSAIYNDKNEEHVVNVKNNGALDFMNDDDVVEINCIINKNGATPIPINNFKNDHIIGMMKTVKAYEKHAVKAGLYGDYQEAINALLVHPLIGDFDKAKGVLDELLEVNKAYLPQFKI